MNENERKQAQNIYNTICDMLDAREFNYTKHDDDLAISLTMRGEDIPMDIVIMVLEDKQIVRFISPMPFTVPEDKRAEMAVAVCVANCGLYSGSFDYNFPSGEIRFRITTSYKESILGKELFDYMLMVCAFMSDTYNDRFMMLSKGMISLDRFIEMEDENN